MATLLPINKPHVVSPVLIAPRYPDVAQALLSNGNCHNSCRPCREASAHVERAKVSNVFFFIASKSLFNIMFPFFFSFCFQVPDQSTLPGDNKVSAFIKPMTLNILVYL